MQRAFREAGQSDLYLQFNIGVTIIRGLGGPFAKQFVHLLLKLLQIKVFGGKYLTHFAELLETQLVGMFPEKFSNNPFGIFVLGVVGKSTARG